MLDRLRRHLEDSGLIRPGSRVLVGYSGGADSTCLLHLLHRLGVDVLAGHLHHGQREEADAEVDKCRAFAEELEISFMISRADVPLMSQEMGIGLEEAGRKARYYFLETTARHYECDLIATAHTRDDHVETVIHHLIRGTGMTGLSGIPEQRGNIVRPLLPFTRAETRGYCSELGLWFHDDPSNSDLSFSRARIRHRIRPETRAINPNVDECIARAAALVREEDRFLNGMAAAALEQTEIQLNGPLRFVSEDVEAAFDRDKLATLPEVLFKRAMRLAVESLGAQLDSHETQRLAGLIKTDQKGAITAIGGSVVVEWSPTQIHVREIVAVAPYRYPLTLPGETDSEQFGWRLTAFQSPSSGSPAQRASLEAEIDSAAIKGSLYFRSVQPADKMRPLGFDGTRKVSDLLGEAKVSLAVRERLPIICDMLGPLWIPGVCLDHRAALRGSSTVTILRFEPIRTLQRHNEETHPFSRA